jgi:deoxyribodipyrimidine photo-lyase
MTSIMWFRQDLRLADNPAFAEAARNGPVVPLFILDEATPNLRALGGASRWWLHHSLVALGEKLGGLILRRGDPAEILPALATETGAEAVFWNRCYEPAAIKRDAAIKADLGARGIEARSFNSALLHEPWEIRTGAGGPFKVYTPFWRAARSLPMSAPARAARFELARLPKGETLTSWRLTPSKPDWAKGWEKLWSPGEAGAAKQLKAFLSDGLLHYSENRDRPDIDGTSRLSPHLHWGEISPRQILAATQSATEKTQALSRDAEKFLSEIGWREFATHLLFHFPEIPKKNWKSDFDAYPWREAPAALKAWQQGRTGYPLVDAGMRELWATGYMHNRVRMVAASFLTKHLRIDWREGEKWFWDTLVDADMANNVVSWQWVAGSGADAAPYFRIFNPAEQARKFDPRGAYGRKWIPELNTPDYPAPIVDHAEARKAALAGYQKVKAANA